MLMRHCVKLLQISSVHCRIMKTENEQKLLLNYIKYTHLDGAFNSFILQKLCGAIG